MFLALLGVSEAIFVPPAWPHLTPLHRLVLPTIVALPYLLIYKTVTSDSSIITPDNHEKNMRYYPYDWALFYPGQVCRTCRLLKPARSKHCSICKACVARHDHHCVWVNNCLGRSNYGYFVALLFTLSILLTYGSYLGHIILTKALQETTLRRSQGIASRSHWSEGKDWSTWFKLWGWAFANDVRIGSVALLALMTAPLALGLLLYHAYLVWAGMTTNESHKWADWREDIVDGVVFKGRKSQLVSTSGAINHDTEPDVAWPVGSDQVLVRRESRCSPSAEIDGRSAAVTFTFDAETINYGQDWVHVKSLQEVQNMYDLGLWENIKVLLIDR